MNTACFGFLELLVALPFMGLGLLGFAFWVWMLVDCALNEPSQGSDKIVWVLVVLFANFIGALIYFFVRRPQRRAALGR